MPRSDEIDPESGIGFFRDTWLIRNVSVSEAKEIIAAERRMAEVVCQIAGNEDDFERLASVAESAAVDDPANLLEQSLGDVVLATDC